jgi:SAM-dependent methyltransferase
MPSTYRSIIYLLLCRIRQSGLRRSILRLLCHQHNSSYHWFSFFAAGQGPHPKHTITNYHQFFIDAINSSDQVIDLGCGHGELAYDLAKKARSVTGLDLSHQSITKAKQSYHLPNLHFSVGDITQPPEQNHYDVAVLSNVLEHIEHRIALLKVIQTYADTVLIRVPMLTRDWITVYKEQNGFEYRLDDTHYIEYSVETFRSETFAAGLSISAWHIAFGELYAVCHPALASTPSQPTKYPTIPSTHSPHAPSLIPN